MEVEVFPLYQSGSNKLLLKPNSSPQLFLCLNGSETGQPTWVQKVTVQLPATPTCPDVSEQDTQTLIAPWTLA